MARVGKRELGGRELIGRAALVLGLSALMVSAVRFSAAASFATDQPALALRFDPTNARALAVRARALVVPENATPDVAAGTRLATASIVKDPGSVDAVAALGLIRDLKADRPGSERLFRYAEALSRRDYATQLWLIERSVSNDDIPGALHHYDVALRTVKIAPQLLFPILVDATAGNDIIQPLANLLATRPVWSYQYMQQLAQSGPDLAAAARVLTLVRRHGAPVPDTTVAALVQRMVEVQRYPEALGFYATIKGGPASTTLRDADFERAPQAASAFDWTLTQTDDITAEPRADAAGSVLSFSAAPSVGGVAAKQLVLLSAGAHRLEGRAFDIDASAKSRPYFRLSCANDARPAGQVELPAAGAEGAGFAGSVTVPAGCTAQWLELVLRPSDEGVSLASGSVDKLALR